MTTSEYECYAERVQGQYYAAKLANDLKAADAEIKRLREALLDAKEAVQSWGAYASGYFQEKWNLAGDIQAIEDALSIGEGVQAFDD